MDNQNQETNRKRKNVNVASSSRNPGEQQHDDNDDHHLDLSLALPAHNNPTTANPNPNPNPPAADPASPVRRRRRRNAEAKSETVPPPYPWATDRRATVHSMTYLVANGINTISGEVRCTKCGEVNTLNFNLQEKFLAVRNFIQREEYDMHNRAPERWKHPRMVACGSCAEVICCKPVIAEKKRSVNWLFLFLGEFIGCCTLAQLKYFCKHTKVHRTGAKDRLIYSTYFELCKQLNSV
ncbi:uncharacterized protein [Spinacia oleracea]|uniref:DUF7086 domain-containing protein n=1 Tax=Spinacia oleracea TaxID=3562 RepID=A0A9R0JU75_SPIOL|nr:uncharacterized protein LOC110786471 [Spinacia oleracea]